MSDFPMVCQCGSRNLHKRALSYQNHYRTGPLWRVTCQECRRAYDFELEPTNHNLSLKED